MNVEGREKAEREAELGWRVILLVEDEPVLRNLLLFILHAESCAVLVAADGQEALELSREFDGVIDLLLTDMEMPRMSGDELGEILMEERPKIRILQISGRLEGWFSDRNLSLAFLQKPFFPRDLISKIKSVLLAPPGTMKTIGKAVSS